MRPFLAIAGLSLLVACAPDRSRMTVVASAAAVPALQSFAANTPFPIEVRETAGGHGIQVTATLKSTCEGCYTSLLASVETAAHVLRPTDDGIFTHVLSCEVIGIAETH